MMWTIALHEYIINVRRPGYIFVTLLFPALGALGLLVGTFFSGQATAFLRSQFEASEQPLGIVDHTGLFASIPPRFADDFSAYPDENAAKQALLAQAISGYVVIPEDYVATGSLTAYTRGGGISGAIAVDMEALSPLLVHGLLAGRVEPALLERASDPGELTRITLNEQGRPAADADGNPLAFMSGFVASYVASILLFISIFISSNYLLRSVSEEKENRVMEVVLSSVSAVEMLAGKVVGLGALGLTQVGVWLLSGVALTGGLGALAAGVVALLNPTIVALALIYFLLGYLMYGTLMATAGSLGTNMRESQQIAGLFSFAAALPWMTYGFTMANPGNLLARVLSWFPLTAPMMMMIRLPFGDTPWIDIVGSVAVLVVTVPLIVWGGAKVFRASLLMYGKRPSLKEIVGALRQA